MEPEVAASHLPSDVNPARVYVLATTRAGTVAALSKTEHLGESRDEVVLLWPRSSETGPDTAAIHAAVAESGVTLHLSIVCARCSPIETLRKSAEQHATVVIGGGSTERQIAHEAEELGYSVVFAEALDDPAVQQ
jgi:hypothetical protein